MENIISSGGQAKYYLQENNVIINGEIDNRRGRKLYVNDVVKIENHIVKVHVIKTNDRKLTSRFAKASVIKRAYSKPVKFNNYDYDLTSNIFKKTK